VKLWCRWQGCEELAELYDVSKTRQFSIDELSTELQYSFDAVGRIPSDSFARHMYKKISNVLLPNIPQKELVKVEKEIDEWPGNEALTSASRLKTDGKNSADTAADTDVEEENTEKNA